MISYKHPPSVQYFSRYPIRPPRPSVRCTSTMRTVYFYISDTRSVVGGRYEPLTIPHSACDAPRPAGEAWVVRPGWSKMLRAATRGRQAATRSSLAGSPSSAVRSATTLHSLAPAPRPCLRKACRAPARCRHRRYRLSHSSDADSCSAGKPSRPLLLRRSGHHGCRSTTRQSPMGHEFHTRHNHE